MEENILYSIITPVFNRADCILRCMESVAKSIQKSNMGGYVEHIVVDDGSHDSTCDIVEKYTENHPYVVFVKFPQNRGTNAARNEAIRRARGKWCIILDSDDSFVDDALLTISQTMKEHPQYKHYMFAPDDMQAYFQENPIIKGAAQKVLLYPDFLNGYIGGDFIHVCNTEILRKHPFDERLRIYEGLFFLMFYRDAQQMLFTNRVVTIRERHREDSVSKEFLRTNDAVIKRITLSEELFKEKFFDDLHSLGMKRRMNAANLTLLDNYVLMECYDKAVVLLSELKDVHSKKKTFLKWATILHGGFVYKSLLGGYLLVKYKILKHNF